MSHDIPRNSDIGSAEVTVYTALNIMKPTSQEGYTDKAGEKLNAKIKALFEFVRLSGEIEGSFFQFFQKTIFEISRFVWCQFRVSPTIL